MMLHLAMMCGTFAILVTIVSAASIELSESRSVTSLASDAKASTSSHLTIQETDENAVIAMINAFPGLGSLPSMYHVVRIFCVLLCEWLPFVVCGVMVCASYVLLCEW